MTFKRSKTPEPVKHVDVDDYIPRPPSEKQFKHWDSTVEKHPEHLEGLNLGAWLKDNDIPEAAEAAEAKQVTRIDSQIMSVIVGLCLMRKGLARVRRETGYQLQFVKVEPPKRTTKRVPGGRKPKTTEA